MFKTENSRFHTLCIAVAFLAATLEMASQDAGAGVLRGTILAATHLYTTATPTTTPDTMLVSSDTRTGQWFGDAVSIDGNSLVIGAPGSSTVKKGGGASYHDNGDYGSAYVFARSGNAWSQQQQLVISRSINGSYCLFCHDPHNSGGSALLGYKHPVAISGDTALVGGGIVNRPAARIFLRSAGTWTNLQEVALPVGGGTDEALLPIAVDGNTIALGTPSGRTVAGNPGEAHIYGRSGSMWSIQQMLTASDAASGHWFGTPLVINGDTLAVGGADATDNAVYVFIRSGGVWSEQQKIILPSGSAALGAHFPIALSGDTIVIGAPADSASGSDAGAAYVYVRSGSLWTQQQKLIASDAAADQRFGYSATTDGDVALIGAVTEAKRAAYVFIRSGGVWTERKIIVPPSTVALPTGSVDLFPMSISGDTTVIGASGDGTLGEEAGAAYINVFPLSVDLSLSKVADVDPVPLNGTVTYTITVANNAPIVDATGVTVTDTLSASVSLVSASPGCTGSGYLVTCGLGTMPQGTSRQVTITVRANSVGDITNTANVSAVQPDSNTANNTAEVTVSVVNTWPCTSPSECPTGSVEVALDYGVVVSFPTVSVPGQTTAYMTDAEPTGACPGTENFLFETLGKCYDVHTTAQFEPPAEVCFTVSADVSSLSIQHFNTHLVTPAWEPVPITRRDVAAKTICGAVNSFSWFVLALDSTPPTFTLNRLKDTLWPPDNKLVKVATVTNVFDAGDPSPKVDIQVTSRDVLVGKGKDKDDDEKDKHKQKDKDDDAEHDGRDHHDKDWEVKKRGSSWEVWVRAEREGKASERIYTLTATVSDKSSNATVKSTTVTVPHDKGKR